jgi:hypothetical protein
VTPRTLVLLHSPLTGGAAWGTLDERLGDLGLAALTLDVTTDATPPYAARYVAAAAHQVSTALRRPTEPVVLVGHSGAGPLLAQVGFALRASGRPVAGYLFVDAGLPRAGGTVSRLDLMQSEDDGFADQLRTMLAEGGRFPRWTGDDLAGQVPDAADRAMLIDSLRPRGLDFFTERLPAPQDWPDAPCGMLRTSSGYDAVARLAEGRGWPTVRLELGHFAALAAPGPTAGAIAELLDRM